MNINIYGSGSAGMHAAKAAVRHGFSIRVFDTDPARVSDFRKRWRARYNQALPKNILVYELDGTPDPGDMNFICTPPEFHTSLFRQLVDGHGYVHNNPDDITNALGETFVIEKPLSIPTDDEYDEFLKRATHERVSVNFQYMYCPVWQVYKDVINPEGEIPYKISCYWEENLTLIQRAHPWLDVGETYLMDNSKGGGSLSEHSHGLALIGMLSRWHDLPLSNMSHQGSWTVNRSKMCNTQTELILSDDSHDCIINYQTDFLTVYPTKRIMIYLPSKIVIVDLRDTPQVSVYENGGKSFYREFPEWDRIAQFGTFFKNAKDSSEMEIFARAHSLNIACWVQDVINTCYEMDIAQHTKRIFKDASSQ